MPFARIVVFALALAHAVGVADLFFDDPCEQVCSDDDCGDCGRDCLPGTPCRCHCPSAMPLIGHALPADATIAPPPVAIAAACEQRAPASPDPREILHVPRLTV